MSIPSVKSLSGDSDQIIFAIVSVLLSSSGSMLKRTQLIPESIWMHIYGEICWGINLV